MKSLYTEEEFNNAKSFDKLPCECYTCKKEFLVIKKSIKDSMRPTSKNKIQYCSLHCAQIFKKTKVTTPCKQCGKEFEKVLNQYNKSTNHFCSYSCNATYRNKHRVVSTFRSKLEVYIETKLLELYPDIIFSFNDRKTIGLEYDIYIPSMKIAFEINGISHYKPIYGEDRFSKSIKNDKLKVEYSLKENITLHIIDTSTHTYYKEQTCLKYLNMITDIINVERTGLDPVN